MRAGLALTRLGGKAGLLLGVVAIAYLATPYSNQFFALLAWSSALATFGAIWALRNVAGVRVARCAVAPAAAGEPRQLTIELTAGRRRFDLTLALEVDGAWVELPPCAIVDGRATITGPLPGMPRGIRVLRRCLVESQWPFGLFRARRTTRLDSELVTWPRPTEASTAARPSPWATARRDDPVAGVRPFRSGDGIADVHWKATARRGELVARERERADPLDLVLDRRCDETELERRLSSTTASVLAAAADGRPVRLRSHGHMVDTAAKATTADLLRWLAGTAPVAEGGGVPT